MDPSAYLSERLFEPTRIHAAAIYCADGRFGLQFDEFLQDGLGLPRYDRIALPGGPAALADHVRARIAAQAVLEELRFLIEVHEVNRFVLIQHDGCAFYSLRMHLEEAVERERVQKEDLGKAARAIYRMTGMDQIEGYFARIKPDGIEFEPVEIHATALS